MNLVLSNVRLALAHFDLEVDVILRGPVTGIFGPSGAGKTSLLELIAGLRRPQQGAVNLADLSLTNVSTRTFVPPENRAIGYVPQDGALFPHLSVRRNLLYGFHARATESDQGLTFDHVTSVLEIGTLTEREIGTLSGGERQRVALGRALLARPRLLLLDEPLAGLETTLRERLMPYLRRIRTEFSIPMVYVSHSPDEVVALCDEVIFLKNGRVEKHGAPTELFAPSSAPHFVVRDNP